MNKIIGTILSIVLFTTYSVAQQKPALVRTATVGLSVEAAAPAQAQMASVYNAGIGASAKFHFSCCKKNFITATIGVMTFSGKADSANKAFGVPSSILTAYNVPNPIIAQPALTIIPIKVGYQYYFSKCWYAEPELGYTIGNVSTSTSANVSGFAFAFGIGTKCNSVDLAMRYENFRTPNPQSTTGFSSFVALRAAFNLNLKKG